MAINVGYAEEDVEVVEVGGPSGASNLDLNKSIEIDIHKTLSRKSPRRKIIIKQTPPQKLTPRTKATQSSNVLQQKVSQKRKDSCHETADNLLKGLDKNPQTFLKMGET